MVCNGSILHNLGMGNSFIILFLHSNMANRHHKSNSGFFMALEQNQNILLYAEFA